MNVGHNKNSTVHLRKNHAEKKLHSDDADSLCGNCGTLIQGNFCHVCGQSAHVHHSLLHLLEEMVHGLWHFDAKGWRTIPLLIAYPGELTRRYIDGQRAKFISPLGLFLFMVFLMFFVFSFSKEHEMNFHAGDIAKAQEDIAKGFNSDIEKAKKEVVAAQTKLDAAKKAGKNTESEQDDLTAALEEQQSAEESFKNTQQIVAQANASLPSLNGVRGTTKLKGASGESLLRALKHAYDNPELVYYKIQNNAYKFALILVPLSLPFLWLILIGHKQFTMFDHAVFSLYSLSFMAFLAAISSVLILCGLENIVKVLWLVGPPIHMFRQLKGTYQLSVMGALWRTCFLCATAVVMVLLFIAFVVMLSLA